MHLIAKSFRIDEELQVIRALNNLHESNQEEKEIVCLELQKFVLHSMSDTEH